MTIGQTALLVLAALGTGCLGSHTPDGGAVCGTDAGGFETGCTDAGARDAGPRPDADVDCLIVDNACVPAYEGAECGDPFQCLLVDLEHGCRHRSRTTIACFVGGEAGGWAVTCYEQEGASPGPYSCAFWPVHLARTPLDLVECADGLASTYNSWPACE